MTIRRRDSLDRQMGFYPFFGVSRPFDPDNKFVTARFLPPLAFGLIRLLIGFYSIVVVIVDIVLSGKPKDPQNTVLAFSYDTEIDLQQLLGTLTRTFRTLQTSHTSP